MCVPGQEVALLVRVAVDRVVEEVGADAAVVEQRVALAGRAVAGDRFPRRLAAIRNSSSLRLVSRTCSRERGVVRRARRGRPRSLARAQLRQPVGRRLGVVLRVAGVDPQRAAVRRSSSTSKSVSPCAAKIRSVVSSEKYEKCSW